MTLVNKKCIPCKGGIAPLTTAENEQLLLDLDGWEISTKGDWLHKNFVFKDFAKTIAFVNKVGDIADQENHHPDIYFTYGKCTLKIQTHKIAGLHENDFILAAKIDLVNLHGASPVVSRRALPEYKLRLPKSP